MTLNTADKTSTATAMAPVHKLGNNKFIADGMYHFDNGDGQIIPYKCSMKLKDTGQFDDYTSWRCISIYLGDERIK